MKDNDREWMVEYTIQVKPGDTTESPNACKNAGPFASRNAAEQFLIQLAGRMALLGSRIVPVVDD